MSSPPESDRLITPANSPTMSRIKRDLLDPVLRAAGLDPTRYDLVYELDPLPPLVDIPPLPAAQEARRTHSLRAIADALDIPPEVISANPDVNWATAVDPCNIRAFEQTRQEFIPRWRYVSGGKALHAFIGDSDRPACGIDPRRGPDRHPARWMDGDPNRRTSWRPGPRTEHGPCGEIVRAHQRMMVHRASLETP